MPKSPDAFRTISEVADWLGVQAHVLRFWESKFTQVKPIKRAGGRRYYRPADMLLLGGIKKLLHDDGLTIKGVQKILREEGMGHVSALSAPLDDQAEAETVEAEVTATPIEADEKGVVLEFAATPAQEPPAEVEAEAEEEVQDAAPDAEEAPVEAAADVAEDEDAPVEAAADMAEDEVAPVEDTETVEENLQESSAEVEDRAADAPAGEEEAQSAEAADEAPTPEAEETAQAADAEEEAAPPAPPKPRIIDLPPLTPESDLPVRPSALTAAFRGPGLTPKQARAAAPLLQQLTALRDRMSAARQGGAAKG